MIIITDEDITLSKAEAIVNASNGIGWMGVRGVLTKSTKALWRAFSMPVWVKLRNLLKLNAENIISCLAILQEVFL